MRKVLGSDSSTKALGLGLEGRGGSKDRNSDMTQRDGEGNPKSKRTPEG